MASDLDEPRLRRRNGVKQLRGNAPYIEVNKSLDDLSRERTIEEAHVKLEECIGDWLILLKEAKSPKEDSLRFGL